MNPIRTLPTRTLPVYVSGMVTAIRQHAKPHLYLREHRKDKRVSAPMMAGRMGMTRESLLRLEREAQTRCTPEKQAQYADALGIAPEALWWPPGGISVDELLKEAPEDFRIMIIDTVKRRVGA